MPEQQDELAAHLLSRVNEASGPYQVPTNPPDHHHIALALTNGSLHRVHQMFYTLVDAVVFQKQRGNDTCPWVALYREEMPLDYLAAHHSSQHRIACTPDTRLRRVFS